MAPLIVRVRPLADHESLATRWRELAAVGAPTAFTAWPWIESWLAHAAREPWLLEARRGRDMVGLALFCRSRVRRHRLVPVRQLWLHATGDPQRDALAIEYNDILARPEEAEAVRAAALDHLFAARDRRIAFDELCLPGLEETIPWPGGRRRITRLHARKPSARVDLTRLEGAYLDSRRSGVRRRLRRALRLYAARGPLVFEQATAGAEALAWFDRLAERHVAKWRARGRGSAFAWPWFRAFHRRLIARHPTVGRLYRLRAGEEVVGLLYLLCWRDHVFFYAGGFDFTGDSRLKPGLVTHLFAIERLRAEGFRVYDLGAGAEPYKLELGEPGPPIVTRVFARPRPLLALEHAARQLRARLRSVSSTAVERPEAG